LYSANTLKTPFTSRADDHNERFVILRDEDEGVQL